MCLLTETRALSAQGEKRALVGNLTMPAAGRRRPSTFALVGRTGKGNVRRRRDGDVWGATSGGRVHLDGARIQPVLPPHRAARQERARQARPRRRLLHPPARPADERLADRDPRLRLAVFAGTVRRVGGPEHEPMLAGRDRPAGQDRPRRVHRARRTGRRRWRSGPCHRRCAPSGASVIKCCYAATGMYMPAAAAILRELASVRTSLSDETRLRRDTKMSRRVSRRVASPACIAGVRVSRPNFSAPWSQAHS